MHREGFLLLVVSLNNNKTMKTYQFDDAVKGSGIVPVAFFNVEQLLHSRFIWMEVIQQYIEIVVALWLWVCDFLSPHSSCKLLQRTRVPLFLQKQELKLRKDFHFCNAVKSRKSPEKGCEQVNVCSVSYLCVLCVSLCGFPLLVSAAVD